MGSRYWITGVQLGMLKAFVRSNKQKEATDLLCKIEDEQDIFGGLHPAQLGTHAKRRDK